MEDRAKLKAFVDGIQLEDVTSIRISTKSGQVAVYTIEGGLAGFSPGAGEVSVTIGYTPSVGGFELPFQQYTADGAYHDIQIGCGPSAYVGTGKFMDDDMGQNVNSPIEGTCNWVGQLRPFKG